MSIGYIGSKKTLLSFIEECLAKHIDLKCTLTFSDLFAGTGIVGKYFFNTYNHTIISNDLEYYSYILNYANLKVSYSDKLQTIIDKLNSYEYKIENKLLITATYTPYKECERMYFTIENGKVIDYCMTAIINLKNAEEITLAEEIFLKASIMVQFDKVANTTSIYGAYLKNFKNAALKKLVIMPIHTKKIIDNKNIIYNDDILNLKLQTDILYLDPPYNNRQYGNHYSQLNYILKYDDSIVIKGKTGLIKDWVRSPFCSKKSIKESIKSTLANIETKILAFSYNNEGLLSKEELIGIFRLSFEEVTCYEKEYKKYKANKNVLKKQVTEYLFVCVKNK